MTTANRTIGGLEVREAADLFDRMSTSETLEELLTLPAYESLP